MKFKSETQGLLKSFITFVNTQFNCQIKCVRTDNGSEFTSMKSFFSSLGILLQTSCPYTPQQNDVVEHKHRHLLNVGRALRFQAHLPLQFYGESLFTATYLINRLPTPVLHNKSPYEILYNKPPTYTHLRVFSCLCYASNLQPLTKFSPRARKCIFVGYPSSQKAYQVYDLDTRQFFSSRDVIFHENIFLFSTSDLNTPLNTSHMPLSNFNPNLTSSSLTPPNNFSTEPTQNLQSSTLDIDLSSPNISISHPPHLSPTSSSSNSNSPAPDLRRSNRLQQPFMLLRDFHCGQASTQMCTSAASFPSSSKIKKLKMLLKIG